MSLHFMCLAVPALAALLGSPAFAGGGDPVNGEKLFAVKCGACHSIEPDKNKAGPSLFGIVDRPSGSVAGYKYSKALLAAKIHWDLGLIDGYIQDPQDIIKGTKMPDPKAGRAFERTDIVAYLRTLK
ncbi:MAG: c-type cytochrome [Aliidongia sp.]